VTRPDKCPRLDWLPAPEKLLSEITFLYFRKHGAFILDHGIELTGKRIFIRIRQEVDDTAHLYEEVQAVVPEPEARPGRQKRPNSTVTPPRLLRSPSVRWRAQLASKPPAARLQHAFDAHAHRGIPGRGGPGSFESCVMRLNVLTVLCTKTP
jgi:hypothetical protein